MFNIPKIRIVEPQIPKWVQCSYCGTRQKFKKKTEYWRTVKVLHLEHPMLLRVRMICAKCQNPECSHGSFTLPIAGVEYYQRATSQLMREGIAEIVEDNVTLERIAKRFFRTFNTTSSKSTLARWKHGLADKYEFPEIIKRLEFSGALCLDECMPRRGGHYEQIAGEAKKIRILYLEPVPEFYGRGVTEAFCQKLNQWGIKPYGVIFDLLTAFPKVIAKVWPEAFCQFDHYQCKAMDMASLKECSRSVP
ncbi:MAG: hypothetical protein AB1393_04330 [Candidatus Edwardsbacteria bacterium]